MCRLFRNLGALTSWNPQGLYRDCFIFYFTGVSRTLFSLVALRNFFMAYVTAFNPYPTAFPYGNGMVVHFYQQQESSTTKTVHKVINKGLKAYV